MCVRVRQLLPPLVPVTAPDELTPAAVSTPLMYSVVVLTVPVELTPLIVSTPPDAVIDPPAVTSVVAATDVVAVMASPDEMAADT